ncbi:MAG: hypothetical protein LBR56_07820 [Sporomusaceae bacterium]|nr:hypothetical protein [Sporomusaceae bacterium]
MPNSIMEKVDRAVELDSLMKKHKKELDGIKAELQTLALADMENKNIKYVQIFGTAGNCEAAYKEKFEIDNFPLLLSTLGDLIKDKISRKVEIKFDIDKRFKEALIVLYKGEYAEHDIVAILSGMGLNEKQIKVAQKKLKGDFKKDKELLASLGIDGDREEELDAIMEAKKLELVKRYFNLETLDIEAFKKCIFVEDSLSITLNYDDERMSA